MPDDSRDVVFSHGVITLSADKSSALCEVARVRVCGGHSLADIISGRPLARSLAGNAGLWVAGVGGPAQTDTSLGAIAQAGLGMRARSDHTAYAFLSGSAVGSTREYGAQGISARRQTLGTWLRPGHPMRASVASRPPAGEPASHPCATS